MSTASATRSTRRDARQAPASPPRVELLYPGDHLDQPEFHRRYAQYDESVRIELIEGVVIVPAAASNWHASQDWIINGWLFVYSAATPGTRGFSDATTILGPNNEVQPDASLLILPEYGGQADVEHRRAFITGAPELVVEVSITSVNYDLHSKRRVYEKAGVREYVVLVLEEERIVWWARKRKRFSEQRPDADGVYRSVAFPGLWLNASAALAGDTAAVLATVQDGIASNEHQAFVAELAARKS